MIDATEATKLADEIADYREMSDAPVYSGKQVANILQHWADRATAQPTDAGMREALKECISQLLPFAEDGDQPAITAAIKNGRKALAALPVAGTTRQAVIEFVKDYLAIKTIYDPRKWHQVEEALERALGATSSPAPSEKEKS